MGKFTERDGAIRLYDGTGTPYYLELVFDQADFSGPLGAPRTEEMLVLNRQQMDSYAHYVKGSDEALMAPVEISLSALLTDTEAITDYLLDWLTGQTVNSNTIATTKGDSQRDEPRRIRHSRIRTKNAVMSKSSGTRPGRSGDAV